MIMEFVVCNLLQLLNYSDPNNQCWLEYQYHSSTLYHESLFILMPHMKTVFLWTLWKQISTGERINPTYQLQFQSMQKQFGYFNQRVVTLVADKLERQWLEKVWY